MLDQFYTPVRWGVNGSLPDQSTCALWSWTRFMTVSLDITSGGYFRSMEWTAHFYGPFNLRIVVFPAAGQTHFQLRLDSTKAALYCWFCSEVLWTEFLGTAQKVTEGVRFSGHRILSLLFADDVDQ